MTRFERHIRELADEVGVRDMRLHRDFGNLSNSSIFLLDANKDDPLGTACELPNLYTEYRGDRDLVAPWVQVFNFNPRSPASYFCTLHEFGHVALKHMSDGYGARGNAHQVECEAEAWLWALDRAMIEPDKRTWSLIRGPWFGSYYRNRGPGYGNAWVAMSALTGLGR